MTFDSCYITDEVYDNINIVLESVNNLTIV